MDDLQRLLAEQACQRLCIEFHIKIDSCRYSEIELMFTEDAVWHHLKTTFSGKDEICTYLRSKSPYPIVRHLLTNSLIELHDESTASGICYVTLFYALPSSETPRLQAPVILVTYHDTFRRTEGSWKFSSRRPVVTMVAPEFADVINTKADEVRVLGRAISDDARGPVS
ncbi:MULTISPECIES: nuclear transport factor 2 family protein [unclassified Chelatococcus]|uniref:nuclear transport factor 2 family protein n=1 Tax=unclassified Chelatococcus TaxID=2638111 RepID=UPI001BD15298|nr:MULTISPECIES: nuclear transport factor 2 family protein [unclassified Chelatococcus]MBS7701226.1 nuclear transport factor 2 family protein [Chelatococcus sp. YT9]MBX3557357.1 nuclear transport factor 2 family protein [Chelatococcus sp.]